MQLAKTKLPQSLVPCLWTPGAACLVLVPSTAATHPRGGNPGRVKKRWRGEQDRVDAWMDKDFTWLPFPSPWCLSLGRAVARARIPFPSHQPSSNPILSVSVFFPEKPLSKACAVGVKRKVSHLSSPLGDTDASEVRREAGQNASWPLAFWRAVPREIPVRELVQARESEDWNKICPGLSKQDVVQTFLSYTFGKIEGNWSKHKICKTVMSKPVGG